MRCMTGHVVSLIMPWNGRQNGGRSFGKAAGEMKAKLEGEGERDGRMGGGAEMEGVERWSRGEKGEEEKEEREHMLGRQGEEYRGRRYRQGK